MFLLAARTLGIPLCDAIWSVKCVQASFGSPAKWFCQPWPTLLGRAAWPTHTSSTCNAKCTTKRNQTLVQGMFAEGVLPFLFCVCLPTNNAGHVLTMLAEIVPRACYCTRHVAHWHFFFGPIRILISNKYQNCCFFITCRSASEQVPVCKLVPIS